MCKVDIKPGTPVDKALPLLKHNAGTLLEQASDVVALEVAQKTGDDETALKLAKARDWVRLAVREYENIFKDLACKEAEHGS